MYVARCQSVGLGDVGLQLGYPPPRLSELCSKRRLLLLREGKKHAWRQAHGRPFDVCRAPWGRLTAETVKKEYRQAGARVLDMPLAMPMRVWMSRPTAARLSGPSPKQCLAFSGRKETRSFQEPFFKEFSLENLARGERLERGLASPRPRLARHLRSIGSAQCRIQTGVGIGTVTAMATGNG